MLVETSTGTPLKLDKSFAKGGEATIWTVLHHPEQVAKVYHDPTAEKERKLALMVANPPAEGERLAVAWPQELLMQNGRFIGYLMPRVRDSAPIFHMVNPARRAKLEPIYQPLYPWPYVLYHMARNLAAAVKQIHEAGHVIGDLNESNVLIDRQAIVTLVDADSFQVRGPLARKSNGWGLLGRKTGEIHRNSVGKPEFTPPELQGVDFKSVDRTPVHDHFGLAVLIFGLLMEGHHPYAGILHSGQSVGRVDLYCMRHGIFPYSTNLSAVPPPSAPSFNLLHPNLQRTFVKTFVRGYYYPKQRPTAAEWLNLLDKTASKLKPCATESTHFYFSHLSNCPQCEPESVTLSGFDYQAWGHRWWQFQLWFGIFIAQLKVRLVDLGRASYRGAGAFLQTRPLPMPTGWLTERRRTGARDSRAGWYGQSDYSWDIFSEWIERWHNLGVGFQWAVMSWLGAAGGSIFAAGFIGIAEFTETAIPPPFISGLISLLVGIGSSVAQRPLLASTLTHHRKAIRQHWLNIWLIGSSLAFLMGGLLGEWLFDLSYTMSEEQIEILLPAGLSFGLIVGYIQSLWLSRHLHLAIDQRIWTGVTAIAWLLTVGGYYVSQLTPALLPFDTVLQAIIMVSLAHLCGTLLTGATFFGLIRGPTRSTDTWRYSFYYSRRQAHRLSVPDQLKMNAIRWGRMFALLILFSSILYWATSLIGP
ncbi:MAG: hypothetical protein AAF702_08815 [Chloroflexota bacterium]